MADFQNSFTFTVGIIYVKILLSTVSVYTQRTRYRYIIKLNTKYGQKVTSGHK